VTTPFGRKLDADDHHALNYLVQSTTADLVFDRMLALRDLLKDKKSFIKFCLHDSVVIDLLDEERYEIKEILEIFSNTKMGKFMASVSVGKDFGALQRMNA
jgi:DNA polymerase I-like protein with 3'-5' exonuclease and polymerase domains